MQFRFGFLWLPSGATCLGDTEKSSLEVFGV